MFFLALQFLNQPQPVLCRFKTLADAKQLYTQVVAASSPAGEGEPKPGFFDFADDYGAHFAFWAYNVQYTRLIDIELDFAAQADVSLMQARAQAQANRAVQADPALRLNAMLSGQGQTLS